MTKNRLAYWFIGLLAINSLSLGLYLSQQQDELKLLAKINTCPTELHYSYFSSKQFSDEAYQNAQRPNLKKTAEARGVIVNHHLLAPNLIAETINTLATTSPLTVILISPNHFQAGRGQIISSVAKWDTPYGLLDSDCGLIYQLQSHRLLTLEESPFIPEHGISGIVSFIKKSLPNAKVIPLSISDTLSQKAVDNVVTGLY